jgi:hypothetical protein
MAKVLAWVSDNTGAAGVGLGGFGLFGKAQNIR